MNGFNEGIRINGFNEKIQMKGFNERIRMKGFSILVKQSYIYIYILNNATHVGRNPKLRAYMLTLLLTAMF